MRIILNLFFFALSQPLMAYEWRALSLQNGCAVTLNEGLVKSYPGQICLFLDDGTFISTSEKGLRRFNRDQTTMWELTGQFHHQVNLSPDKKRVLALSSEVVKRGNLVERDDLLLILDVETGKTIHRRNAREIVKDGKFIPPRWGNNRLLKAVNATLETSHFNSIYEVPKNKGETKASYLKAGNIIANSSGVGTVILSPDLRETLYFQPNPESYSHQVHDVQVSSTGEFLLFNNLVYDPTLNYAYSSINKYDPVKNKTTFKYTAEAKALFFSAACGGVQELDDDTLFFSHIVNGGFLYSRKQKKILHAFQGRNGNRLDIVPTQQLKLINFRSFLDNSSKEALPKLN